MHMARDRLRGTLAAFLLTFLATPSSAQSIIGQATAVDGDSLSVGGMSVRIFGIDAPEGKQTCSKDGSEWPCGEEARTRLERLISHGPVRCDSQGVDTFGRTVAICKVGGMDLGQAMVGDGWALAFTKYSSNYVGPEAEAKRLGRGIWSSTFQRPEEYRAANRVEEFSPAKPDPPAARRPARQTPRAQQFIGCVIKGNRNRRGEWIYHLPGMPYYDQTRAEEMFCSEADARAAGYRRAIVK